MKLSLFILLSCVLMSCHKYDDYKYETREMALFNADNSGEGPVDAGNAVSKKAFSIRMRFNMFLTFNNGNTDSYESSYLNEDLVTAFNISSPDTVGTFLPFSSLNSIFHFSSNASTGLAIHPDRFNRYASGSPDRYASEVFPEEWTADNYLYLMDPPDKIGDYTFIVDFVFSDGRLLSDTVDVTLF